MHWIIYLGIGAAIGVLAYALLRLRHNTVRRNAVGYDAASDHARPVSRSVVAPVLLGITGALLGALLGHTLADEPLRQLESEGLIGALVGGLVPPMLYTLFYGMRRTDTEHRIDTNPFDRSSRHSV
jgi:uncharacterized membrane protein YeaQ/YmgE (transglycosylase-associated protein family)